MGILHSDLSLKVLEHLGGWGFPPDVQQRIGALCVVWGVFETNLEPTLWALRDEQVAGIRPSTDKTSVSDWISLLGQASCKFNTEAQEVVTLAAEAARDLMEYRHALVHGWMIPSSTMPSFIRNPSWNEEKRNRPVSEAHVTANLLDMAIDSAWTLCRVIMATKKVCADSTLIEKLTKLRSDVLRAKSQASELRHLADMVNSETY